MSPAGEHVVDRRLAVLVNDDPVPGGESRTPGEIQLGCKPDSEHHHGGVVHPAVGRHYPLHVPMAVDAFDTDACAQPRRRRSRCTSA